MATWRSYYRGGDTYDPLTVPPANVPVDGMVSFFDQVLSEADLQERVDDSLGKAWVTVERSSTQRNSYTVRVWGENMDDIHKLIKKTYTVLGVYGNLFSRQITLPDNLKAPFDRIRFLLNWIFTNQTK